MTIRIVLADDQLLVRSAFALIFSTCDDIEVVGTAADGVELLQLLRRIDADVVLMDVRMPRMDGITATLHVVADHPQTRVLVLSTFDEDDAVYGALAAGASGYLLKDAAPPELITAVRAVSAGEAAVGPTVARRLLEHLAGDLHRRQTPDASSPFASLTEREYAVLLAMTGGRSNQEIATAMHLSETTVKTHVGQILRKLGVRDRTQAVVAAFRAGHYEQES